MIIKRLKSDTGTLLFKISLPNSPQLADFYESLTEKILKEGAQAANALTARGGVTTLLVTHTERAEGGIISVERTHTLYNAKIPIYTAKYTDCFDGQSGMHVPQPKRNKRRHTIFPRH